jgi:mRNA interferase RelE/StbE
MATYKVYWKKSAQKELKKLSKPIIPKIISAVEGLAENPYPPNSRKYLGTEHTFRIRVGSYRIIYTVVDEILTIEIIKIGHRKDIYKK